MKVYLIKGCLFGFERFGRRVVADRRSVLVGDGRGKGRAKVGLGECKWSMRGD